MAYKEPHFTREQAIALNKILSTDRNNKLKPKKSATKSNKKKK